MGQLQLFHIKRANTKAVSQLTNMFHRITALGSHSSGSTLQFHIGIKQRSQPSLDINEPQMPFLSSQKSILRVLHKLWIFIFLALFLMSRLVDQTHSRSAAYHKLVCSSIGAVESMPCSSNRSGGISTAEHGIAILNKYYAYTYTHMCVHVIVKHFTKDLGWEIIQKALPSKSTGRLPLSRTTEMQTFLSKSF